MRVAMVRVKGRYQTAALKVVSEPYARIMEKIGFRRATEAEVLAYEKSRVRVEPVTVDVETDAPEAELSDLRAEYERVFGKKPFGGWKADKLREKIAEADSD